jgi:chromate transporter
MLKIGLFTFGGGYAMIALLENEFVSKRKWIEKDEFLDMVAIAESTPGPIAINAATYIGYKILGFLGSLTATIAICIPSFIIIYAISLFFDAFLSLTVVAYAFRGIQVCVIWLILSAGLKMLKRMKKTAFNIVILSAVISCMLAFSVFSVSFSTIFYILISGFLGLFLYAICLLRKKKEAQE